MLVFSSMHCSMPGSEAGLLFHLYLGQALIKRLLGGECYFLFVVMSMSKDKSSYFLLGVKDNGTFSLRKEVTRFSTFPLMES